MKYATAELIALLNSGANVEMGDLYTITLLGGGVLRYTSADRMLTDMSGNAYTVGPLLKRSKVSCSVGIQVDSLDMDISAGDDYPVNGTPLMAFIAAGGLDGARVRLDRAFLASWETPVVGTLLMFSGRVNDISMDRFQANIQVQSDLELLDAMVPRNLYQPGCVNTLYDSSCGVSKSARTVSGSISGTPTRSVMVTGASAAASYFSLGVITFTSGPNAGISRTIKDYNSSTTAITTIAPFPITPAAGNTFTMYPGCDKTQATCTSRYSNVIRFRGAPYIPVPETAV